MNGGTFYPGGAYNWIYFFVYNNNNNNFIYPRLKKIIRLSELHYIIVTYLTN